MRSVLINMGVSYFAGQRSIMQQPIAQEQTGRGLMHAGTLTITTLIGQPRLYSSCPEHTLALYGPAPPPLRVVAAN
jgi:hypothetical protein